MVRREGGLYPDIGVPAVREEMVYDREIARGLSGPVPTNPLVDREKVVKGSIRLITSCLR